VFSHFPLMIIHQFYQIVFQTLVFIKEKKNCLKSIIFLFQKKGQERSPKIMLYDCRTIDVIYLTSVHDSIASICRVIGIATLCL